MASACASWIACAAAHRVDNAVKLTEHGVTRRVDDAPLMRSDEPLGAGVEFTDQHGGPFLVSPHHAAETGNVDHDDGRELAARCGGFRDHAKTIMTLFDQDRSWHRASVAEPSELVASGQRDGQAIALVELNTYAR